MGIGPSTTVKNPCEMLGNIKSVNGKRSKSSSPSDIWVIDFKTPELLLDKPIYGMVMKFWPNPSIKPEMDILIDGLNYETKVYYQISRLINEGVCDNFVQYITSATCYGNQLSKFPGVSEANFNRNASYIDRGWSRRPSINDNKSKTKRIVNSYANRPFKILCTVPVDGGDFDKPSEGFNDSTYSIIFQVFMACFSMQNNGITHNDLHTGNILLTSKPPPFSTLYYKLSSGIIVSVYAEKEAKVFDFDRSYSRTLGKNNILDEHECKEHSQCNRTIPNIDMIKFACYLISDFSGTQEKKSEIMGWLSSDRKQKNKLLKIFQVDDRCFLRRIINGEKRAMYTEEYAKFATPEEIVENCAKTLMKKGILEIIDEADIPEGSRVNDISKRVL
jgi:hypothetical protein